MKNELLELHDNAIPQHIIDEAERLYEQYKALPNINLSCLEKIKSGQRILANEFALAKVTKQPFVDFLTKHRKVITSQLYIDGRQCNAVALVTFRGTDNKDYVLINQNQGKFSSLDSAQWTSMGVRVESNEEGLIGKALMDKCRESTKYSPDLAPFAAAAIRVAKTFGVDAERFPIKKLMPVNRIRYNLQEAGKSAHRTEHVCIVLEDLDPSALRKHLKPNFGDGDYADHVHVVELQQFLSSANQGEEEITFSLGLVALPVRPSMWKFLNSINALNIRDAHVHNDGDELYQRHMNPGNEFVGMGIYRADIPKELKFSLLYEKNNRRQDNEIFELAEAVGANPEDIAANSLKPERVLLREIIAQVDLNILISDESEREKVVGNIYNEITQGEFLSLDWDEQLEHLTDDDKSYTSKVEQCYRTIKERNGHYQRGKYFNLELSDEDIAKEIVRDQILTESITAKCETLVSGVLKRKVENNDLQNLKKYPLNERISCCVIGPVASGKSSSVKMLRKEYPEKQFNHLCSDNFINILLKGQDTTGYHTHRGWLILSEAWYIKERFNTLLQAQIDAGSAPSIIYETINLRNIPIDQATKEGGKFFIYMNTASPFGAVERMESRGKHENRYVDPQTTLSSYSNVSQFFVSNLSYLRENFPEGGIELILRDTDALFYKGIGKKPDPVVLSADLSSRKLIINSFSRLLTFIDRAKNIAVDNQNPSETWSIHEPKREKRKETFGSLFKLFSPLSIQCDDGEHKFNSVDEVMVTHDRVIDVVTTIQRNFRLNKIT